MTAPITRLIKVIYNLWVSSLLGSVIGTMKYIFFTLFISSLLFPSLSFAEPVLKSTEIKAEDKTKKTVVKNYKQYKKINRKKQNKPKITNKDLYLWKNTKINWAVYSFVEHGYFEFENAALSKLVWNNMLMVGYGSRIDFSLKTGYRMQLEVEGASNYAGYSTDDDLRNYLVIFSYGTVLSTYAHASINTGKTTNLGKIKNSWLAGVAFSNHDFRMLGHAQLRNDDGYCNCTEPLSGVTQDYNIFLLGAEFQTDFSYQFKNTVFSLIFKPTLSLQLAVADWPYRKDFAHPVSFITMGFAFSFEFRLRSQTFFTKNFSMHMDLKMAALYTPPLSIIILEYKTKTGEVLKNQFDMVKYSWGLRSGVEIGMDFHF